MTRRLFVLPVFLLSLLCAAIAQAQTSYTGSWVLVPDGETTPAMLLDLTQDGARVTGSGDVPASFELLTPGQVSITQGAAFDGLLQLQLSLPPNDEDAILSVFEDGTARLTFSGTAILGQLSSVTPDIAPVETPTQTPTLEADICEQMTALQQSVILGADTAMRAELERVYAIADAGFGLDLTDARCTFLLGELTRLADPGTAASAAALIPEEPPVTTTTTTPVTPTTTSQTTVAAPTGVTGACAEVPGMVGSIYAELSAQGLSDDGTIDDILNTSGLGTDGIWSTGACEYGLSNLSDYLNDLSRGGGTTGVQTTGGGKDPTAPVPTGNGLRDIAFQIYDVSENLNMRSGPGTGFGVVYQLPYFARDLRIIGQGCSPGVSETGFANLPFGAQAAALQGQWCNVDWNGQRGWVSGRYIRPMP